MKVQYVLFDKSGDEIGKIDDSKKLPERWQPKPKGKKKKKNGNSLRTR